jgi:ketosteroid isomerase-like protein
VASDNVETVRRLYQLMLAAERLEDPATAEIVPQFFDPEVLVRQWEGVVGTAGDFYGYRGVAECARELLESFAGIGFVLEKIQAADDVVAVAALYRGTGRRSGAPFEGRIGHLFTLRDGLITRWEVFDDPARAFRAAGLADVGLGPEPGSPDA